MSSFGHLSIAHGQETGSATRLDKTMKPRMGDCFNVCVQLCLYVTAYWGPPVSTRREDVWVHTHKFTSRSTYLGTFHLSAHMCDCALMFAECKWKYVHLQCMCLHVYVVTYLHLCVQIYTCDIFLRCPGLALARACSHGSLTLWALVVPVATRLWRQC